MKPTTLLLLLLLAPILLFSQIGPQESRDIFRRQYNAELTYDVSIKYICQELLAVEHNKLADVTFGVAASAKSGELTTIGYHSDILQKQGLVFVFWNDRLTNETFFGYDGYGFRNFDLNATNVIITRLTQILEDKKVVLEEDKFAIFQYEDVTFVFKGNKTIYVCWKDFRALWTTTNLETTIKRVEKFLKRKNG